MLSPASDLLNTIRTSALSSKENRQLLSTADDIESLLVNLEKSLDCTHSLLAKEQSERQKVEAENAEIQEELRKCLKKIAILEEWRRLEQARRFGRSSERWTADEENQALLFDELEVQAAVVIEAEVQAVETPKETILSEAKNRGKREKLPENLPCVEIIIDLPEAEKVCGSCGKIMNKIGEESSECLQVKPAEFYREKTICYKYGCSCGCGGVHAAPVPERVYPKSLLGDTVLTQIVASKFCDALPFYRIERILSRSNIEISRQTMARGAQALAVWLQPLQKLFNQRLEKCPVLCADETRIRVLKENGIKKDGNSYMWVASGSDESGAIVRFHYGGGRSAAVARELLGSFAGILMCDGYGAYPAAVGNLPIRLAACMAHVRRQFHDVLKADSLNPLAKEALEIIGQLYSVERDCVNLSESARLAIRQERARPVFEKFRTWLFLNSPLVTPASGLGKAFSYTIKLMSRLEVYLEDGDVPIDNNRAENTIRPFVVGRKNWLFNAVDTGAEYSAALYSIIETAKANQVEPLHYIRFLCACSQKFGYQAMPWADLFPRPELRNYATNIGVPWEIT